MPRDSRLIVIASEDCYAVKQYFERFRAKRVKIEIIPTLDGRSSPKDVYNRLLQYRDKYDFGDFDSLWIVTDADRWLSGKNKENLHKIISEIKGTQISLAVSFPCFCSWLLLHLCEHTDHVDKKCKAIEAVVSKLTGCNSKKNVGDMLIDRSMIERAIASAKSIHTNAKELYPEKFGSHVYKIVEMIVGSSAHYEWI